MLLSPTALLCTVKCQTYSSDDFDKKRLSIWDLHSLMLLLLTAVNLATKWKVIGVGLRFSEENLKAMSKKLVCVVGGPLECLHVMLAQWLRHDKHAECDQATTCVLAIVLRHPSVDERQLANKLESTFQPAGTYLVYISITVLQYHVLPRFM